MKEKEQRTSAFSGRLTARAEAGRGKKTKAMKTLRWILPFYFLFLIATSVFAQDPEAIFTEYFDKVLNHENSSAYSLISAEDKKIVTKDDFERSPWPFINQDVFINTWINLEGNGVRSAFDAFINVNASRADLTHNLFGIPRSHDLMFSYNYPLPANTFDLAGSGFWIAI